MNTQHHGKPVAPTRATANDGNTSVAALAFELRQAGIAQQGLGFALRTLGSDRVLEELRTRARFGARCQRRGVVASNADERAAWTILAAAGPRAIEGRLERDGLIRRPGRRPREGRPSGGAATRADASVVLLRGRAEFGGPANRTPFQEQLAEVALALAGAALMRGERPREPWPFSFRPPLRGGRPPTGASSRVHTGPGAGLTAPGTFDCEAMGARADRQQNRTATVASAPERVGGRPWAGGLPPLDRCFSVQVDQGELRLLVRDAGETFGYELRFRTGRGKDGGVGWSELSFDPRDGQVVETSVRASEVMALAREAGLAEHPARMTEWVAGWFEQADCHPARRLAARLRAEVAAGRQGERIAVRRVRAIVLERLVAGEELVVMAERGGFTNRGGRPDTSWLLRRAGLAPMRCSRTGKLRTARTAPYDVFCQLVAAVDRSPHEFGV